MVDFPQGPLSPLDQQRALRADTTARVTEALAAATAPKMNQLAQATPAKKALLGGGADAIAAAVSGNNSAYTSDQFALDANNLSPIEIGIKYGEEGIQAQRNLMGAKARAQVSDSIERPTPEIISDTAKGVGQGAIGMLLSPAALIAGAVSPELGVAGSQLQQGINSEIQGSESDTLQQARAVEASRANISEADNARQQEVDAFNTGPVTAGTLRVGRDAVDAIGRAIDNPTLAGDAAANAAGSLAATAAIAAATGGSSLAVPLVNAVGEGGGAYTQTVNDAINDPAIVNSDLYKERIAAGDTDAEAKAYAANRAGLLASVPAAAIGAVTGKLVEPIERLPFKGPKSVLGLAKDVGKEVLEESTQTAAGDISSNVAQKVTTNENKDILQGVGTDVGSTILGTIGSTVGSRAPSLGIHAIGDAARSVYTAGNDALSTIADNVTKRNEKLSPVSAEKVEQAATDLGVRAPEVAQSIQDAIPETATPAQREEVNQYVNNINNGMALTDEEKASLPVGSQMEGNNRIEAMIRMAQRSMDANITEDERLDSALWTLNQMTQADALFMQNIPSVIESTKEDHPVREELQSYLQGMQFLQNHPVLRDLRDQIAELQQKEAVSTQEVTPEIASQTADLAVYNPAGVNPTTAAAVLHQADRGVIQLDPAQSTAIRNSVSLLQAARTFQDTLEELAATPKSKTPEEVAQQVIGQSLDENYPSMNDHLGTIMQAIKRGDGKGARAAAQRLAKFAKHMGSKVDAINRSFDEKGADISYGSDGRKIFYKSPRLAKQIYAEAKAVAQVANSVAHNYPEFGIHEIPIVSLRPAIRSINAPTYTRTTSSEFKDTPAPVVEQKQEAPVETPVVQETKVKEEPKVETVQVPEEASPTRVEEVSSNAEEEKADEGLGTESESKARTVAEAFPSLVQDKGKSHLHEAFSFREEGNTLKDNPNPFQTIKDALVNRASLVNQKGSDIRYAFDAKLGRAYSTYLDQARPLFRSLNKQLKDYMSETVNRKDKGKATRAELFEQGDTLLHTAQGRILNLLDQTDKGLAFNQELIQKAILAALHWNLNADRSGYRLEEDELRKAYGLKDDDILTADQIENLNAGISLSDAKRGLGDLITQFWGVKANDSAPLGFTKGIPEGVAANLLEALHDAGLISLVQVTLPNNKTPIRVIFDQRSEDVQAMLEPLNKAPLAIADAILPVNPDDPHVGEPVSSVPDTQMRNPLTKNTAQQKLVIERANKIPYYTNVAMADFLQDLGEDALVDMLGGDSSLNENTPMNEQHRKSVEGINSGIRNSYKNVQRQLNIIEGYAQKAGVDLKEMPQYYEHNMSRVGRLHMLGSSNPQADKVARELFVATVAELDLRNSEHKDAFFLTLAQALGVKTELKQPALAIAEVQEALESKFSRAAEHINDWYHNGAKLDAQLLKDVLGGDMSMKAIHALIAYAKYKEDPNASSFEHHLSLEADGKTDGPINAIMNFTAGEFTPQWIQNMAKGGLFVGETGKTLNDHYTNVDSKDLYQTATDRLENKIAAFRQSVAGTPVQPMMGALLRVMSATMGDLKFESDTGKLTLKRGIAKNPLTITVYGSGIDGIAGKVTGAIVDEIYAAMSKLAAGDNSRLGEVFGVDANQFQRDLNDLIYKAVVVKEDGKMDVLDYSEKGSKNVNPAKFKFTDKQLLALKSNVKAMFVRQLDASIREMMGPSMLTTQRVQTAIQIMSLVAKEVFEKEVDARLALKERKDSNFLSQRELNKIYKDTAQFHPVIDTGYQQFFVGGTERGDLGSREFSKSLGDQLSTPAYTYGPVEAGVGGIPYMVIGTGDGQMVQNIFANTNIDNVLAVFDGIELPASKIKEYSELINKSVWDAWQLNPVADVAQAFRAFLRNDPFSLVPEGSEARAKIEKALDGIKIEELSGALTKDAESIAARKEALTKVPLSIDHMASASAPYSLPGSEELDLGLQGPDTVALTLNKIVSRDGVRDVEEAVSRKPVDFPVEGITDEFGNRILTVQDLPNLAGLDPSHLEIIRYASRIIGDEWRVIVGVPGTLALAETQNNPNLIPAEVGFGKTDFASKIIYITNPSSETIAHELLHAATFSKVEAFYGEGDLSSEDREAISRIEGLMGEFLGSVYNAESMPVIRAREMADATIHGYLNEGRKAEALNEFMAWVLTNKNLATVASETKVLNPVYKIAKEALAFLRKLIFGGFGPKVGDDLWSNLRFNTRILLSSPHKVDAVSDTALYQSAQFGASTYLTDLREKFFQKIAGTLNRYDGTERMIRSKEVHLFEMEATDLTDSFNNHGWTMTPQEQSTFKMLVTALGVSENINQNSLVGIEGIYSHVMSKLTVEDLMDDPKSTDPNDRYWAQERFNALQGVYGKKFDPKGRSTLMPSFLALAMTNNRFRVTLQNFDKAKRDITVEKSALDQAITDIGMNAVEKLTAYLTGEEGSNALQAMDSLVENLLAQKDDDKSFIENQLGNAFNQGEAYIRDNIQRLSAKADAALQNIAANSSNSFKTFAANVSRLTLGIINNDVAEAASEAIGGILNRQEGFTTIRELFNELVGRTKSNAPVWDMITKVRTLVQQTRQQFREHLPAKIAGHFKQTLSENQWSHLFKGMAKTDLSSLVEAFKLSNVIEVMKSSSARQKMIQQLETRLRSLDAFNEKLLITKARELAKFMNTGEASANQLRNAYAIANLFGEGGRKARATQELINVVDQLVSLYALDSLDADILNTLSSLAQNEQEGMEFTLAYLVGQRKDELARVNNDVSRANHYKGWIPLENENGHQLTIIDDRDGTKLLPLGFTRVADYRGSVSEGRGISRGYYYAPVSGRATFNQGILQTVRSTASGVDPITGKTIHTLNGGVISDAAEVARIARRLRGNGGYEALLPIYDGLGNITAFERQADVKQLERLNPNRKLHEMIGAWKGRQAEEHMAREFNNQLIDTLANIWQTNQIDKDQFVDLFDSKDPVIRDAAKLISPEMKDYIKNQFGGDEFWVRKDMLNDSVGFRQASVGDAWTGVTRWDPKVTKKFKELATAALGNKAYPWLVKSEEIAQKVVASAKELIVVKSVIVPFGNIMSNMWQLAHRGVPVRDIIKGMGTKTVELNAYIKNRDRQISLEADIRVAVAKGDVRAERKARTEWQQLEDANKRLSIWDLIEAGEFTSISTGGPTQEDLALASGKYIDMIEKLADKVPGPAQTLVRYALVTKDTALYKALARATQYGDFLAKAILYENLRKKRVVKKEAIAKVSEEFINYNRLAGRTRNYMESIGALWFWNFKIRSAKIALSMIRENPVRALLSILSPMPQVVSSLGSPLEDNIFSVAAEGNLGYSVGPSMGLNSLNLNPWVNLTR